jgi:hypothetical protein
VQNGDRFEHENSQIPRSIALISMRRKLTTIGAAISLVICLAAAVMWARSLRAGDLFVYIGQHAVGIRSEHGLIEVDLHRADADRARGWWHDSWLHAPDWSPWSSLGRGWLARLGFAHNIGSTAGGNRVDQFVIPYYFVVGATGLIGAILFAARGPFSRRFSLRMLLIATTLVAVGLGLAAWAIRS